MADKAVPSAKRKSRAARSRAAQPGLFAHALEITHEDALELWRRMLCMRLVREARRAHPALSAAPESAGAEALLAGACAALSADDFVAASATRLPSLLLARAETGTLLKAARRAVAAPLDNDPGFCLAPDDASAPGAACGAALACKIGKTGRIAACFFSATAAASGLFHEALQLAAQWQLPALFICESAREHGSSLRGTVNSSLRPGLIHTLAPGYGIGGVTCDGMTLLDVREAVLQAAKSIRAGGGPALLEAVIETTPEDGDGESRDASADPIRRFEEKLVEAGAFSRAQARQLAAELAAEFHSKIAAS
jgi:pyruvate dehydrogenase E1 component alpha subunit